MYGRIARIQVLWIDRNNPNKVIFSNRASYTNSYFSSSSRYEWKLMEKNTKSVDTVKIPNIVSSAKKWYKWIPVKSLSNCITKNITSCKNSIFDYLECYSKKKSTKSINWPNDSIGTVGKYSHKCKRISNRQQWPKQKSKRSSTHSVGKDYNLR